MKKIIFTIMIALTLTLSLFAGISTVSAQEELSVSAKASILCDADTGSVICSQNADERMQIASMVKIMTLNVIFDEIEKGNLTYETEVVASERATSMGGSQAFLDTNCSYKAGELIKSIIVASANDSCVAMAEHISGSVETFVEIMNAKAKEWEMENTNFVNCTGLPATNQYCTANDVVKMSRKLFNHKGFYDFSKIWTFEFAHPSGRTTTLTNTNKLVRFYEGCDGGKTGFTNEAKSCLSATAKRGDTRLICVVMGANDGKTRNAQVTKLLNYGFANYESKKFVTADNELEENIKVENGKKSEIKAKVKEDIVLFGKKGEFKNYRVEKNYKTLSAPVEKGDTVGEICVLNEKNEVIAKTNLVSVNSVEEKGYLDFVNDIIAKW